MGTYRQTCSECGETTETECWEPDECPFCALEKLRAAADKARSFIKLHHWRFCPPDDKWPEGSWDLDAAKEAHDSLYEILRPNK